MLNDASMRRTGSLADAAFEHIGQLIIEGQLKPGDRVRDHDFAGALGQSRTPVREALQRLERIGLVVMHPSRFTVVSALTPAIIEENIECLGHQAGIVARLATLRMTDKPRQEATHLVSRVATPTNDQQAIAKACWTLITFLASQSENDLQWQVLDTAEPALLRALHHWSPSDTRIARLRASAESLSLAIGSGDASGAERAARALFLVV